MSALVNKHSQRLFLESAAQWSVSPQNSPKKNSKNSPNGLVVLQGYLAHKKKPTPLGPPP